MKTLYIGDIMAAPGIRAVSEVLPKLKREYAPDIVIAQAENVSDGKSITPDDFRKLQTLGIDFFTGGNHTPAREEIHTYLRDVNEPIIGPANMVYCPGDGFKYISTDKGRVLVISLLGSTVGRPVDITNPLIKVDEILEQHKAEQRIATIVNFHGDYSSEKRVIGYYLDSKVTAVIGDHWHVPTADASVLPGGTAHMSDVGMCGTLHSSLGVKTASIIERWKDSKVNRNEIELSGPLQFNAALIESNSSGSATAIKHLQHIID